MTAAVAINAGCVWAVAAAAQCQTEHVSSSRYLFAARAVTSGRKVGHLVETRINRLINCTSPSLNLVNWRLVNVVDNDEW